MCSGSSTQCGSPSLRDPHWMRLNVCHEGALKCKRMWFSAWKKCSPRVTECMVELLDSPFQTLQMDSKFDALEELFIHIMWRRAGLIDQPRAENDFLSEKPESDLIDKLSNLILFMVSSAEYAASEFTTYIVQ